MKRRIIRDTQGCLAVELDSPGYAGMAMLQGGGGSMSIFWFKENGPIVLGHTPSRWTSAYWDEDLEGLIEWLDSHVYLGELLR